MEDEVKQVPYIKSTDNDDTVTIQIPQCCREGWESCPHVINRDPIKSKRNIGL